MFHTMKLKQEPFEKIRNGSKTIELRLQEITRVLLDIETDDPMMVFGYPDAFKVRSCMTLLKHAVHENDLFQKVLDKFCQGKEDDKTVELLGL